MNEFFTWQFLATFAGAVTATTLLTQFLKGIFSKMPTQVLSYIVSVVVLIGSTAATSFSADWSVWAIIPLNAVLVSLSANGAYMGVQRIIGKK